MHRAVAVSLAILLGSMILPAQTSNQNQPQGLVQKTTTAPDGTNVWTTRTMSQAEIQQATAQASPMINTCPVSLRARQTGGGDMVKVNGVPVNGVAQRLHLIVTNPDSRRVVAANVTVRGFADKARFAETLSSQDNSDAARTMDVRFLAGSGKEVSADLRVPGLTAVSAIDLNSVTYADGSIWKLAAGGSCRSWIDGLMLVSGN
jgi:secreted PhoX family phosphatase